MVSDKLREFFTPYLTRLAALLDSMEVSPNALTIIGLLLNIGVAIVLATGHLRLGGLLIIPASAFDGLDGALARHTGKVTRFGAFFDSSLDRYAEGALFTGLVWAFAASGAVTEAGVAMLALVGSLLVSYTRARAEGLGLTCTVGIMTRAERIGVLAIGLMLGLPLLTMAVIALFANITAVQRMVHVYRLTAAE